MSARPGLVVVGSVALDSVETSYGRRRMELGGAAVYFSLASRHFAAPRLIGVVGSDFPSKHINMLRRQRVDLEGLQSLPGKSFHWAGRYSPDGNTAHTLETRLGVFAEFRPEVPAAYRRVPALFLANIDPDLQLRVLNQMPRALVGGDTMNFWIESKRSVLDRVLRRLDLLFVNEHEARQLTGEHSLMAASRGLLKLGPKVAVVKKGEHGSMIRASNGRADDILFCPPYPVTDVRDPTGAGDSFAGAFMGYLAARIRRPGRLSPESLSRACAYGSVVASFTVQSFGVKGLLSMRSSDIQLRLAGLKRLVRLSS
ncbi:sugar kinase [bacterium]|nr:sugar kinase [bacterium]